MTKRPNGTWKIWENVEKELRALILKHNGTLPGASVFKENNLAGLYVTLQTDYGGLEAVRERLGVAGVKFCPGCQVVLPKTDFRLKKHKRGIHRDNICRSCSNTRVANYRSTWWGKSAEIYHSAKDRSKALNRDFDLTREWIFERLVKCDFKCEASGIELVSDTRGTGVGFANRYGASLDRIDSKRGYTKDNVRIVAIRMNIALGDLTDEQFEEFAIGFLTKRDWKVSK